MGKSVYGLTGVKSGAIAVDGGMGTVLTELLGATVKGTASLIYTPPTYEDKEIEESDDIYDSFPTSMGKWEFKLDSYNVAAATLFKLFGGTFTAGDEDTPDKWGMPDVFTAIEESVEMVTRSGEVLQAPRMKLVPAPNFNFTKADAGRLSLVGTIMKPTKANTPSLSFSDAPVA